MRKINCITFPRSGHQLLVKCLLSYFGNKFRYTNNSSIKCKNPNFIKEHDKNLGYRNNKNSYYIIQWREDVMASLISLFELDVRTNKYGFNYNNWKNHIDKNLDYWKKFVDKWIINNNNNKTFYLKYEDLVDKPEKYLKEVIKFISPKTEIDKNRIKNIVGIQGIYKRRTLRDLDKDLLKEVYEKTSLKLNKIKMKFTNNVNI